MTEFKPGDRVRRLTDTYWPDDETSLYAGKEYIVRAVEDGSVMLEGFGDFTYTASQFEPVEAAKPTAPFEATPLDEAVRVYFYADGTELEYEGVTSLHVSESGAHRLTTAWDGQLLLHYVAPGWIAFTVDNRGKGWNL